ncbi:hypothetical protein P5673_022033, partial [Acropora cervicornis]
LLVHTASWRQLVKVNSLTTGKPKEQTLIPSSKRNKSFGRGERTRRVSSKDSTAIRRGSFRFSLRRRSRLSREDTRNSQNGDACDVLRPRRAGDGQSAEARTSKEVGSALRAIGDDLNNSTLSLHSAT